eukprot:5727923-Karenia_brevis.AAC.1
MLTREVVHPHEDSWCMGDDYPLQFCENAMLLISDALRGVSLPGPMKHSQCPSVPQHHIMFTMDLLEELTSRELNVLIDHIDGNEYSGC